MLYLSSTRIVRTFGIFFAVLAAVLFAVSKVVVYVLGVANGLVAKAIARYSSFTGRMALENFPEDKALYAQVKSLQTGLLPTIESLLPVIVALSVVLLVLAILCFALPRQLAQVLVAFKLWKGAQVDENAPVAEVEACECDTENVEDKPVCPKKKIKVTFELKLIAAVVALIVIGVGLAISFSNRGIPLEKVNEELASNSKSVVSHLKQNFQKTKKVDFSGEFPQSEIFEYKSTANSFTAVLKEDIDGCPAGSTWKISATVKGLFQKSLNISRVAPKDSACVKIMPDFKSVGR